MVVIEKVLYRERAARYVVRSLGISEARLRATEKANPGVDWLAFTYALDRIFLSHGGAIGQVSFLSSPSQTLSGRTPFEAIAEPGGPHKICRAARAFSACSN